MHLPRVGQTTDESSVNLGWILASIGGMATLAVVWTVCACCRTGKKRVHEEISHAEEKEGGGVNVADGKKHKDAETPVSERSFATVYAVQIPQRGKVVQQPTATTSSSVFEESETKAALGKASVLISSSKRNNMSTTFPSKRSSTSATQRSVECNNVSATSKSGSQSNVSRAKYRSPKIPVQMAVVGMLSLLVSSGMAERFINDNVADIGLAIRYCTDGVKGSRSTRMAQLLSGIADDWPISEDQLRVGVAQGGKILSDIAEVATREAVKQALNRIQPDVVADQQECQKQFPSAKETFGWKANGRTGVPTVYIDVMVLQMTDSDQRIQKPLTWHSDVFSQVVAQKKDNTDVDVVLVLEIGDSLHQYGIFEKANGSDCCYLNDKLVAKNVLAAIRRLLATCPLEVGEKCVDGFCEATVAAESNRYCLSTKRVKCSACLQEAATGTPTGPWKRGRKQWTYLIVCASLIIFLSIVAVVASVRQCVLEVRKRKEQKQRLADYGMIGVKKKHVVSKTADMMTVIPATLGETRLPSSDK